MPADKNNEARSLCKSNRLISESELELIVEAKVRQILAEMLGISNPNISAQWYDTNIACQKLGLDSSEQLREYVRCGLLRIGIEVRDRRRPKSQKPRYQFHVENCEARLNQLPEKRK